MLLSHKTTKIEAKGEDLKRITLGKPVVINFGVRDRSRTCIIEGCNLVPSLSDHTHINWYRVRVLPPFLLVESQLTSF